MRRVHLIALALIAVVPAAVAGSGTLLMPEQDGPCFSTGAASYRLTTRYTADFTIRVDNGAARPDLTVQVVDDPVAADFVLLDEAERVAGCRSARTIRVDPAAAEPDLVIALTREQAEGRVRIYAQAPAFRAEDAAALFAVMIRKTPRRVTATLR